MNYIDGSFTLLWCPSVLRSITGDFQHRVTIMTQSRIMVAVLCNRVLQSFRTGKAVLNMMQTLALEEMDCHGCSKSQGKIQDSPGIHTCAICFGFWPCSGIRRDEHGRLLC